ncbi:hypothetical protein G7Z17_g2311 [Cylindrodendrum hubeiense]|uniref:Amidohydrolase 3 domain-containing protein n=1 Tax=Cylindrodendrum hubeiense TaxID=595255 RepID=A0A9P5HJZ2_9HYPO|nr:hypothetical protein G7Z17_g2311 [Cylindrodendrum hubeiense]
MAYGSLLLCVGAISAALFPTVAAVKPADVVFHNGSIYTMDCENTQVSGLAIKDGAITYTGSSKRAKTYIGKKTKVIDLKGRMAMPGLVDSHMHVLSGGLYLLKCDLSYQSLPIADIIEHITGCIAGETGKTDDDWLEVVNMDYPGLVERSGSVGKLQLDKVNTKRPIIIRSSDYHTVIANSRALDLSNITAATADPAGGKIVRVSGSQEPSGVLQDSGSNLLAGPPAPSDAENLEAGRAALKLLREAGITTFQDAAAGEGHHTVFNAIKKEDGLSSRAYFDYRIEAPSSVAAVTALVADVIEVLAGLHDKKAIGPKPTLKWQAVKAFIDGVITYPSNTAALIDPYWAPANASDANSTWAPDPKSLNEPYWKPAILTKTLELLFLAGIDAQLHVDGDLAVRVALNAAASFRKKHPGHKFKLGLAHDELTHEDDWARFAKLEVDPIVSYQWSQLSSFYIPSTFKALADYRLDNLQSWAQFEKAGRPLVYGSDWPIDPLDEFLALKVAVTRSGDPTNPNSPASQGAPFDAVFPTGSGISRKSALRSITINGARFLRADKKIGSLESGKLADIIVLDKNFFKVPKEELGRQKVLLTMVGGEVVYVANGQNFGVTPKFANNDAASKRLARRTIGGFAGQSLSEEAKANASKLRKRGTCVHRHYFPPLFFIIRPKTAKPNDPLISAQESFILHIHSRFSEACLTSSVHRCNGDKSVGFNRATSIDVVFHFNGILKPNVDYTLANYDADDAEKLKYILKILWAWCFPFFTTHYLSKASLLAFYLHLFPIFMVKRRLVLWATIAYCVVAYIVSISVVLFVCFPIDRNWSVTKLEGSCRSGFTATVFYISWALNLLGSLVLAVYSIFLLGLIDIALSLTRFLVIQLGNAGGFRSTTLIELVTALDLYIGLIVACLPSLRPYLRQNPGQSYQDSDPKPSQPTLPPRRLGQNGFAEIDEMPYTSGNVDIEAPRANCRRSDSPDIIGRSTWNFDRKSNKSDIELVTRAPLSEQAHA